MERMPDPSAVLEFGRFKLDRHRRELTADGVPVELGGRAFDTLLVLIDGEGAVLSKDVLMRRIWPDRVVDENNLEAQISALRRVFGADRNLIRTVAGLGYQFTGAIGAIPAARAVPPARMTNLPQRVTELIGRDATLRVVTDLVTAHRLVTLIGAGGVGKTRLGFEVARRLLGRFPDGVWLAELGPLSDPDLVPVVVAAALGLPLGTAPVTAERIAAAVGPKQLLLLLDNCEHVIGAAARMAAALLTTGPAMYVLATSREPLRTAGEHLYRVPSLEVPAHDNLDIDDVLRHGAVQLFSARASAVEKQYALAPRLATTVAAICRHLDGIPLAIELAAARVAALGVEGIAARLDDRFRLLTGGKRTALTRHQTLRATLDWSYELLSEPERVVLRRLATFAGSFTLEAMRAVVTDADLGAPEVLDSVANLVAKSLVVVEVAREVRGYRLLETTRVYLLDKLVESGDFDPVARRHSEYYRDLFEQAETEWETRPRVEWLAAYGGEIDNVRTALDWAFSPSGDALIGVALTAAAVPLWLQLSLLVEGRGRLERALASLGPRVQRDPRREMQLFAALGVSLTQTKGPAPDTLAAWMTVLETAERLDDTEFQLRALWGQWQFRVTRGEWRAALALAERFRDRLARTANPAERPVGDRIVGVSLYYLGEHANARRHLERIPGRYVATVRRSHTIRFQYDQQVAARAILARILWLQGFPDQARRTAQENLEDARAIDHALSLCHALEAACLVALWSGDLAATEHSVAALLDHTTRHALAVWHARARCLNGIVRIRRGDAASGFELIRATLDGLRESGYVPYHTASPGWDGVCALLGTLAQGLSGLGQVAQGLATVDEALARSERDEERWCIAELLCIKADLVLLEGGPGAARAAEEHFQHALDWARRQDALSLELRAATSLAHLWHGQRRTSQARTLLSPVYRRFTEGFGTADLVKANALLAILR